jgi:glycosyltransferase involved in cell wall biosynthesis
MTKETFPSIVYLATYPPRACGIATFTYDLITALDNLFVSAMESRVVAMLADSNGKKQKYGKKVLGFIHKNIPQDYISVARLLNSMPEVKLVNIQHEFGIFGKNWGKNLSYFLDTIKKPVVTTFHTVLPNPSQELRGRVRYIAAKSEKIIVMTALSKHILEEHYQVLAKQINIVPHGIHAFGYSLPGSHKTKLSLDKNKIVLSSFGLLSRGKGIEYMIRSLPAIIKKYPHLIYLVIGATHPEVLKQEGEFYRQSLQKLVTNLKLEKHVQFRNAYVQLPQLLEYLQATDIYISPSLDPNQAVSGTLSYALGAGRPVIATQSAQAKSIITPETGALVGFRNPTAISRAVLRLLKYPNKMEQMGKNAYFRTRHMTWENVALSYARLFSTIVPELTVKNMHMPPIKLDHMARLTDKNGIFQFARLNVADPESGHTLDDNARALMATVRYYEKSKNKLALKLSRVYLQFVGRALGQNNKFTNYFNQNMTPNTFMENRDSQEDADARALRVLMEISPPSTLPKTVRAKASKILQARLSTSASFSHPRAMALYIIGLYHLYCQNQSKETLAELDGYCKKLTDLFTKNSHPHWRWFETQLTYSNSILSEALLIGFLATKRKNYFAIAKKTLDFLIGKTFIKGMYMPIGQNGWYSMHGKRSYFDQQPEDAATMVQTLAKMYQVSGEEKYYHFLHQTFLWFLGENPLGQLVYDTSSGGCYDGIGKRSINLNQGAESTISFLLARLTLENLSHQVSKSKKTIPGYLKKTSCIILSQKGVDYR